MRTYNLVGPKKVWNFSLFSFRMNFKQVVFETPRPSQSRWPLWWGAAWRSRSGRQPHGFRGHLRGPGGDLGKCRVRRRPQRNGDGVLVKSGVENQVTFEEWKLRLKAFLVVFGPRIDWKRWKRWSLPAEHSLPSCKMKLSWHGAI